MTTPRLALCFAASLFATSVAAQIRPMNYTTPSYIDFEVSETTVSEADKSVTLTVFRHGEFRWPTSIEFATAEATATEGDDFSGSGGSLVFQPGETMKTITIAIQADEEEEETEVFRVDLSSSNPNVVFYRSSATVHVEDSSPALAPTPPLQIVAGSPGTVAIFWESEAGAYVLERCATCVAAGNWENVPVEVSISGGSHIVVEPVTARRYFYRLRAATN